MFWVNSANDYEPNLKFRFLANFVFANPSSVAGKNNIIDFSVKSITAPSINLDFERAYANQHVHYFQNGSIHWEPIQIVLHDFSSKQKKNILSDRLFNYLQNTNEANVVQYNRTQIIDLPIFCENIEIKQFVSDINQFQTYFNIIRPRINKIDFGSFDYTSDEINTITLTVIPEWCTNKRQEQQEPVSNGSQNANPTTYPTIYGFQDLSVDTLNPSFNEEDQFNFDPYSDPNYVEQNSPLDINFDEETPAPEYKEPGYRTWSEVFPNWTPYTKD